MYGTPQKSYLFLIFCQELRRRNSKLFCMLALCSCSDVLSLFIINYILISKIKICIIVYQDDIKIYVGSGNFNFSKILELLSCGTFFLGILGFLSIYLIETFVAWDFWIGNFDATPYLLLYHRMILFILPVSRI